MGPNAKAVAAASPKRQNLGANLAFEIVSFESAWEPSSSYNLAPYLVMSPDTARVAFKWQVTSRTLAPHLVMSPDAARACDS